MKLRTSRVIAVIAATGLTIGLAACSGTPSDGGSTTPGYVSTYKAPDPTQLSPLTGVVVPAGSVTTPSIEVKICNVEACMPQEGLGSADIVFEEVVEAGITRYMGVWQSAVPDSVGPVRSLRPMDADMAASFGGPLVYSGWGAQETRDLAVDTGMPNITENNTDVMYRNDYNVAPYNLMVRAKEVVAQNAGVAPPQQQFAYSSGIATSSAVRDGAAASSASLVFSNVSDTSWGYDPASGKYLRSQWGGPETDRLTGAQLATTNIAIMKVNVVDFVGVPRTIMVDSGEAWVMTGGKAIHGTWTKPSSTSPIQFRDDFGVTVRFAPGNTWIEMVPNAGGSGNYGGGGTVTINP